MTILYDAGNHILIHTGYGDPAEHRHMAAHIIVAAAGRLRVTALGEEHLCGGVMIPSGVPHEVDTDGNPALVFLYDSTTAVAKQINSVQRIPEAACEKILSAYERLGKGEAAAGYAEFEGFVLNQLNMQGAKPAAADARIVSAMRYIQNRASEKVTCKEVAESVFLSQSRFSHLFRQQAGMTFAAYLIYQRILRTYAGILCGESITAAALDAGFSGSAHFADVNRRLFGLSAASFTSDLKFLKVH